MREDRKSYLDRTPSRRVEVTEPVRRYLVRYYLAGQRSFHPVEGILEAAGFAELPAALEARFPGAELVSAEIPMPATPAVSLHGGGLDQATEVQRLTLGEGEMLVLLYPQRISMADVFRLKQQVREALGLEPGRVMVLDQAGSLAVVAREEAPGG